MKIPQHIFKSYDIRGLYPEELNEELAEKIAKAYVKVFNPKKVVLGKDVRESGPALWSATAKGFTDAGVDVIDIGTVSTDQFYFAVGTCDVDGGITISASHNPREWNGMNICKKGAEPVSSQSGMHQMRDILVNGQDLPTSDKKGTITKHDTTDEFLKKVVSFVDYKKIKPCKLVANANFGMDGVLLKRAIELFDLPIELVELNCKPDGTFPKGHPNPLLPENREEFVDLVVKEQADLGVAWDADGDRCFFADEKGNFIEGYFTTALLATEILKKHNGATILIDPRLVWATTEAITNAGGEVVVTKPGMTLIADRMKEENAVFAGEMSSHFYFKENFNRDNGMIPLFLILEMISTQNKTLSQLVSPHMSKFFTPGEINFEVENKDEIIDLAKEKYNDGKQEFIDGLSVAYKTWRFNIRKSNTEPLLRLNLEATSQKEMKQRKEEMVQFIEGNKK